MQQSQQFLLVTPDRRCRQQQQVSGGSGQANRGGGQRRCSRPDCAVVTTRCASSITATSRAGNGRSVSSSWVHTGYVAEAEASGQFVAPLLPEYRGSEDAKAGLGPVEAELPEDDAGLNCLAEPDLVGKKVADHRVLEDSAYHLCLVRQ